MIVLRPAAGIRERNDELAFAPDGAMLAAPRRARRVLIWSDLTNGSRAELLTLPGGGGKTRIAFLPDNTLLAGNDHLFAIDLLNRSTSQFPITPWGTLWFGISPATSRVIVAEQLGGDECRLTGWVSSDHLLTVWETTTQGLVRSAPLFPAAGECFVWIEYRRDPNRGWLAYCVTRSCENGTELAVSPSLVEVPDRVALSPEPALLACCTRDQLDIYPNAGPWAEPKIIKNNGKKHFTGIAFHPSGKYLAATSNDATVKLYDTTSWKVAKTFTWDIGRMRSIAFSPDGTLAAAGSDSGKVVVWDVDV